MKKLFNKKPIIKQKDKICSSFNLFNKNIFYFFLNDTNKNIVVI